MNNNNPFLVGNIPQLYLRTALPIIVVFMVNGVYNLVNAFFVGRYLGEAALSAVTLVFPVQMLVFALATVFSNNYGASLHDRVEASFRFGLRFVLVYCMVVETILLLGAGAIGEVFVSEGAMATEATKIARFVVAAFVLFGPVLIVAGYFQAIGRAKQAIVISLAKNYLFLWPLVMALPLLEGEMGIWMSFPVADAMAAALALVVFKRYSGRLLARERVPAA